MNEPSRHEQRRVPRVRRSFIARYRIPSRDRTNWLVSPLRDLSSGGARFLSEYPFEVGALLEMALLLPASPQPITVKARVAWTKPWRAGLMELGVTFDVGDVAIQEQLNLAISHFLHHGRGSG